MILLEMNAPRDDQWDRLNNVEQVRIPTPLAGQYTIEIRAHNIPIGSQDYAWAAHFDNLHARPASVVAVCTNIAGQPC